MCHPRPIYPIRPVPPFRRFVPKWRLYKVYAFPQYDLMIARMPALSPPPVWLVELFAGFMYWLVFLLVLEPGNILRAYYAGYDLAFDHEALRITAASCLGALVTPSALWLSRRLFPARQPWHILALTTAMAALSVALILVSCLLAAWIFEHVWVPSIDDVAGMLAGNGVLLVFALLAFCGLELAVRRANTVSPILPAVVGHIMIKTRGRQVLLKLDTVVWIESQGNYLAFHTGDATHLIRSTLSAFEGRLDPSNFVRIHRSHVVALDRVTGIEIFDNGDGILYLNNNTELKISRNYRKVLLTRYRA